MAQALVSGSAAMTTADPGAASVAVTAPQAQTAGNNVFAWVMNGGDAGGSTTYSVSTITDTAANTWTLVAGSKLNDVNGNTVELWQARGVAGGTPVVTATFTNTLTNYRRIAIFEVSGGTTSANIDSGTGAPVTAHSSNTVTHSTVSRTPTANGCLVTVAIQLFNGGKTFTAGSGYTKIIDNGSDACVSYLVQTTAAATTPSTTTSAGDNGTSSAVVVLAATSGSLDITLAAQSVGRGTKFYF